MLAHIGWRAAPNVFVFHPANGGARRPIEAAILKSLGVVPFLSTAANASALNSRLNAAGLRRHRSQLTKQCAPLAQSSPRHTASTPRWLNLKHGVCFGPTLRRKDKDRSNGLLTCS